MLAYTYISPANSNLSTSRSPNCKGIVMPLCALRSATSSSVTSKQTINNMEMTQNVKAKHSGSLFDIGQGVTSSLRL